MSSSFIIFVLRSHNAFNKMPKRKIKQLFCMLIVIYCK
ncbi:hypothetical protein YPPY66_1154 [Yersinia pestis PY-66]|uniref:Uncharacterized protein n=1 Tax=Yersinia pestis PY-08 TaxID=992134 RepID=A0AB72ZNB7_YERPE|nr:hypothetical protein YpAngola_A3357 [Yersinia pestis Angola]EDR43175.1 hypothetical protein YpE1979001_3397 [Yersinia pestis biovar Antiqua str. E1979001]EDR50409.1 hypothetical protein YpB42003004_3114 [Yersinia pestis biovar Antiqua str. B42003004]EDR58931.1 hypothetical protein YpMG051020_2072 [Yersinia pestis biovar Orientalis str. MG05-1020]EFA46723.1 conserved hypothetical protein [Yersinia pestis KIM D27]EIQ93646.1 hypothetical protein YPPY02_0973 [Yersinia pestis PY-02]EIQ95796.1 h